MPKKKNPETPEVETTETVEQEPKQETKAKKTEAKADKKETKLVRKATKAAMIPHLATRSSQLATLRAAGILANRLIRIPIPATLSKKS